MASNTAAEIVKSVGGAANIESLTHCATRLRFQLRDASGIEQSAVEAVPGVMGAVPQAGDRYQVVIGGGVQNVYNDIMALPGVAGGGSPTDAAAIKAAERAKGPRGKFAWLDSLFEFLSDSFRPHPGRTARRVAVHHFHGADEHAGRHPELGRPAHRTVTVLAVHQPVLAVACSSSCR